MQGSTWLKQLGLLIGCSLLSALLAVLIYRSLTPRERIVIREPAEAYYTSINDPLDENKLRSFLSSAPTDFIAAAEAVTPAVVFIRTYQENSFNLFRRKGEEGVTVASGSGVIISKDGYIVTNNHVIEGGSSIEVVLNDKREFQAEVIGTDPSTDLALLRIESTELPFANLGNSDSLRVGEWVLAVGNPFNLESTVTAGIVSAKGRSIDILEGQDRIESFIQTDAAVNPGNSGGALVNTNGELIGINTAIITRSGRYEGYSFAVPANLVRKIVKDLRDYGLVQRGLLGVFIDEVTANRAKELGLSRVEGVLITRVTTGSGAEEAGLRPGDVIVRINGHNVRSLPSMQETLGRLRPGNRVKLEYIRSGRRHDAEVILKNKSNSTTALSARQEAILHDIGFEARNLTKEEERRLDKQGVKVLSIFNQSLLAGTNMEPGFIITSINNRSLSSMEELVTYLERIEGQVVLGGFYEKHDEEYFYTFEWN